MAKNELEERTLRSGLALIDFVTKIEQHQVWEIIIGQLNRSGTWIGANYREANRARSRQDFIHKCGIVEKDAAETCY